MTAGLSSYAAGSISLVVVLAALAFGATGLRRWIAPELEGATRRLAEAVFAVTIAVLTLQVLGTVGLLAAGWIQIACVLAGVTAGLVGRSLARPHLGERATSPPAAPRAWRWIAIGVACWTFAEWTMPTLLALDHGMFGGDSVWYHMPTSARFAQEGTILPLHFTDALRLTVWYYPHSYELIDGAGIAMFGSDFAAPLFNLVWLGMALLAAWCVGRPFGLAPLTLVSTCLVLNSGLMVITQAGEARNDIMALALLLSAIAVLITGHHNRRPRHSRPPGSTPSFRVGPGPLIVAGLATGLALSTKLTVLVPAAVITVGLIAATRPAARRRTSFVFCSALALAGSFWFVRNLAYSGNPLPIVGGIGPLGLPQPDQLDLFPRPPHSVIAYAFDVEVIRYWFVPQLDLALGIIWPVILVAGLASVLYALVRPTDRLMRILAIAALLSVVAYLVSPIGASGPPGEPKGFFTNTRYLMASLTIALVTLPLLAPLRASPRRRRQTFVALTGAFALTSITSPPLHPAYLGGALLVTAGVLVAPILLGRLRSSDAPRAWAVPAMALALAGVAVGLGSAQASQYERGRYADPEPFYRQAGPVQAFRWVRDIRESRIGVVGSGEVFFTQYAWYGADLSNYVQFVGVDGPRGAFRLPRSCAQMRREINTGQFDYLVGTRFSTDTDDRRLYPVRQWLRGDEALGTIMTENVEPQQMWVYRVEGEMDPRGCPPSDSRPGDADPGTLARYG